MRGLEGGSYGLPLDRPGWSSGRCGWRNWQGQELQRILTDRGTGLFHGVGEEQALKAS